MMDDPRETAIECLRLVKHRSEIRNGPEAPEVDEIDEAIDWLETEGDE